MMSVYPIPQREIFAVPDESPDHLIRFGLFEVDVRSRELRKQGAKIKLQDPCRDATTFEGKLYLSVHDRSCVCSPGRKGQCVSILGESLRTEVARFGLLLESRLAHGPFTPRPSLSESSGSRFAAPVGAKMGQDWVRFKM